MLVVRTHAHGRITRELGKFSHRKLEICPSKCLPESDSYSAQRGGAESAEENAEFGIRIDVDVEIGVRHLSKMADPLLPLPGETQ